MQTIELVVFGVWCFSLAVAGGAMGLVLGNLRAPASIAVASSLAAGLGANITISGAAAAIGSIGHIRAGRVNWPLVALMTPPSILGGAAGALLSSAVPERVLLISIAVVMLWNAWALVAHIANPEGTIDLTVVAVGIAASAPGALVGARLTGRLSERQLVKAIGITVGIAGLALLARAAAG